MHSKDILGGSFRAKRLVRRLHSRWEGSVQKDALDLFHTQNWKSATQQRQNWRKKTGEATT